MIVTFGSAPLVEAAGSVNTWWPTDGSHLRGAQPFKAVVDGLDVSAYEMYWQVDGGTLNLMQNSSTDYPHKEADVDISGWSWHGTGPYAVTYVAKQNGTTVSQKTIAIFNDAASSASPASAPVEMTVTSASPASPTLSPTPTPVSTAPATLAVWWPSKNATLTGTQPFKAVVTNQDVNAYAMYWQVDGGPQTLMQTSNTDGPHKEVTVDVSSWHWQPSSSYTLTFTAKDPSGATIATYSEPVTINPGSSSAASIAPVTPASGTPAPVVSSVSTSLFADPNSSAASQAAAWGSSRPSDAARMKVLANAPTARWFGGWSGDIRSAVASQVTAAANAGKTAVLVAYNIPQRDCGGYSAGGANDYLSWITSFANGIGSKNAIVILEPDSLAQVNCLSSSDQSARYTLLAKAVAALKSNANTKVYLDAGHAGWVDTATMAARLRQANVAAADGFSLNVSNYDGTASEAAYGNAVSASLGGKHFVIDTSRNGNGGNGEWCNASGRAIGTLPTTQTGIANVDAFLWVKTPGESDGNCSGGPSAGSWWPEYALGLVQNAQK